MASHDMSHSLSQKCMELSNLIREKFSCNMSRSVLSQFRPIVEGIFGHDSTNYLDYANLTDNKQSQQGGWHLKTLTRASNQGDFDAVISFLHPEGVFFALIKSLMSETSAKFEFPVVQFPPYFRLMIENGTAPPFFANKIISTSYVAASHLILNPFEFFIFHFGLYILNNNSSSFDGSSSVVNEPAYFTLLKIYLNHFVPLDNAPQASEGRLQGFGQSQSIWQSLSSTTSSILNLATSNNPISSNTQNNQVLPTLFKASIFQPHAPLNQNVTTNYLSTPSPIFFGQGEHLGSVEWRCSTFLLMLTELWFGNIPAPKTNYVLRTTSTEDTSFANIQPYSANIDQMTAVRIVVKHLHNFANTFTYSPISHASSQGLTEIKQAIWSPKYPLQKRFYHFIKVAFNRWPLDYTFRQPLEAWLSYIQPWRYVKINCDSVGDFEELDSNRSTTLIDVPSIDNHWRNFISDNLLYYTVIFTLFVNRLMKLDLSSSRNALMLFRVMKVYSQPGFLPLLREAEEAVLRNNLEQSFNMSSNRSPYKLGTPTLNRTNDSDTSKAKLLAPVFMASGRVSTSTTRIGALEHLSNLENDSDFNYVSVFSPHAKQLLSKLLIEIQKSRYSIKEFVQTVEVRSKLRNRSWLESVKAFITMDDSSFESKDEREMYKDKIQAEDYLEFAMNKIVLCFDVQVPEVEFRVRTNTLPSSQGSKIFFNF